MFDLTDKTTLQIEPTTACALECPQCARYHDDFLNPLMRSAELTVAQIQQLCPESWVQKLHKMFMCGNYGEPAAARDCLKIYQWFRKINPDIVLGMNTSGSLRNIEWWQQLATIMNGSLDYVVFSIDGLEDTNHIYRRNSNWHKIIENAQAFIDAGGSAQWDMLVFDHNQHQIDQAQQLAQQMGFTWFRTKYTDRPITAKIQWLSKVSDYQPTVNDCKIHCHYEQTKQAYLNANGEWLPCCYIGGKIDYPDIEGAQLREIFNQSVTESFENQHLNPAWQTVWNRWNSNPLLICKTNCSDNQGQPRALDKWRQEIQLK
jgi:MoaA/NifB/PqqE/SkfB family radical SAM enzyme